MAGLGSSGSYTLTVEVSDIVDDHANSEEGATAVSVGEAASGVLEYYGDTDFFVFQSEEGVLYQIDVALGTLSDSTVALHDADGRELSYTTTTEIPLHRASFGKLRLRANTTLRLPASFLRDLTP